MSLTINEAIARFEANAEQNERWANAGLNPEANAEYAAEHRQLAEWLRELQERRKAPEIIRCKDCQYFGIDGQKLYCRMWQCHTAESGYCHLAEKAERRTDEDIV